MKTNMKASHCTLIIRFAKPVAALRVFAVLSAILTLAVATSTAMAQLYIAYDNDNSTTGGVGSYDLLTGAPVNPNLKSQGSTNRPSAMLVSGNTLYLASTTISGITAYDATTGSVISSFGASGSIVSGGQALGISGNLLYVAGTQTVGTYNATTGATVSLANPINTGSGIFQFGLALSSNTLYVAVADFPGNGSVATYNATTGALLSSNFITGLSSPRGLALSGTFLYVAQFGSGTVTRYDATTGLQIPFASPIINVFGIPAIAVFGNVLYVSENILNQSDPVRAFDAITGAPLTSFGNSGSITPVIGPRALAVGQVPEPGTVTLAAIGLLAVLCRGRRRHSPGIGNV